MNLRVLLSLLPVAVFFGLSRVAPPWVSISGGFAASTIVFATNRRDRLIGSLTAFGFVVVAISAAIGIVWSSEKAYLASGPIAEFLFVPLFGISIAIRRPLVGGIAQELFPKIASRLAKDAPVFIWLSVAWGIFDFFLGLTRALMLSDLSVGEYIIWSRVVTWPFSVALLGATAYFIYREARRLESDLDSPAIEPDPQAVIARGIEASP